MNVNEVLANRAEEILGGSPGQYRLVHPIHHVNKFQSTNDVYPTALKVAALGLLVTLENEVAVLQQVLQEKEGELRNIVKVSRTELVDAVPMTLGMTFGAFAEAVARDRWRIFKSRERIKRVNLGGTAIGTGLGAPRDYVLKVTENLRHICGCLYPGPKTSWTPPRIWTPLWRCVGHAESVCRQPAEDFIGSAPACQRA